MLHFLRRNKNSKVVWVALAGIIGVFTFWGIGVGVSGQTVNSVATVDGRPIEQMQILRAEHNMIESYRNAYKDKFTPEMKKALNVRQRALDTLIDREVLLAHADKLGITVGDQELRDAIASNPSFLVDGRFSKDAYLRALRYAAFTPADFEGDLRDQLAIERLQNALWDGVSVSDAAVRDEILQRDQKVTVRYVKVKASEFTSGVEVTDEKLRKYYDDHKERYADPERVRIEMIAYRPDAFAAAAKPTDEDLKAYYEDHRLDRFTQQHEVHAHHILVKVPEDADDATKAAARQKIEDIEKEVKAGGDFEKIAREKSEDEGSAKSGGDLGFFGKGRMVEPFEQAAFALKPGEVSGVVESPFGYHLIRVDEVHEEREKPLDEVRDQIAKSITDERSKEAARAAAEADQAAWKNGKAPEEIANARGIPVERPEPLRRNDSIEGIGRSFPLLNALWELQPGAITPPVDANGTWVVARLVEKIPAATKPFEEVKDQVETAYRIELAGNVARDAAFAVLTEAQKDKSLDKAAKGAKREMQTSDAFNRGGGYIQGIGSSLPLKEAAFALSENDRLPKDVFQVAGDWFVIELDKIESPSDQEIAKQTSGMRKQMVEKRRQGIFTRYLTELKQTARIAVDRQKLEAMPAA